MLNFLLFQQTNGDYGVVPRYTLFPTYQLFNHSCIPNAISYEVNEKYKVVRACQEIPAGAEVNIFQVFNQQHSSSKCI